MECSLVSYATLPDLSYIVLFSILKYSYISLGIKRSFYWVLLSWLADFFFTSEAWNRSSHVFQILQLMMKELMQPWCVYLHMRVDNFHLQYFIFFCSFYVRHYDRQVMENWNYSLLVFLILTLKCLTLECCNDKC